MQAARDYALNALSKGLTSLQQVSDAAAAAHASRLHDDDASGGSSGQHPLAPSAAAVGPSLSSVTSTLVTSLASALSNSSLGGREASGTSMGALAVPEPESVRVLRLKQELAGSCINIHALKRLAFHGIPDKDNLRGTVWKVSAPPSTQPPPLHPFFVMPPYLRRPPHTHLPCGCCSCCWPICPRAQRSGLRSWPGAAHSTMSSAM